MRKKHAEQNLQATHPLDSDGMLGLYNWMFKNKDRVTYLPFPDTIVYEHHFPRGWFSYQKNTIIKRSAKECDTTSIYQSFHSTDDKEIVASFAWRDEVSKDVKVNYLSSKDLQTFLFKPLEKGILQRFLAPSGPNNDGVRVVWTPSVFLAERWMNKNQLSDSKLKVNDRAQTEDVVNCYQVCCAPNIIKRVREFCEKFIDDMYKLEKRVAQKMLLEFKLDRSFSIWMIRANQICLGDTVPKHYKHRHLNANAKRERAASIQPEVRQRLPLYMPTTDQALYEAARFLDDRDKKKRSDSEVGSRLYMTSAELKLAHLSNIALSSTLEKKRKKTVGEDLMRSQSEVFFEDEVRNKQAVANEPPSLDDPDGDEEEEDGESDVSAVDMATPMTKKLSPRERKKKRESLPPSTDLLLTPGLMLQRGMEVSKELNFAAAAEFQGLSASKAGNWKALSDVFSHSLDMSMGDALIRGRRKIAARAVRGELYRQIQHERKMELGIEIVDWSLVELAQQMGIEVSAQHTHVEPHVPPPDTYSMYRRTRHGSPSLPTDLPPPSDGDMQLLRRKSFDSQRQYFYLAHMYHQMFNALNDIIYQSYSHALESPAPYVFELPHEFPECLSELLADCNISPVDTHPSLGKASGYLFQLEQDSDTRVAMMPSRIRKVQVALGEYIEAERRRIINGKDSVTLDQLSIDSSDSFLLDDATGFFPPSPPSARSAPILPTLVPATPLTRTPSAFTIPAVQGNRRSISLRKTISAARFTPVLDAPPAGPPAATEELKSFAASIAEWEQSFEIPAKLPPPAPLPTEAPRARPSTGCAKRSHALQAMRESLQSR